MGVGEKEKAAGKREAALNEKNFLDFRVFHSYARSVTTTRNILPTHSTVTDLARFRG